MAADLDGHPLGAPPEASSDSAYHALDRRLAILEERTAPKPKPLVEKINSWTGLATFALALIFTYAFGVWEKVFVSPAADLRNLIVRLTDTDMETAKLMQSTSDPQMRSNLGTILLSKKNTLLLGSRAVDQSAVNQLSVQELQLLGWHYASLNYNVSANKLYEIALQKAKVGAEVYMQADTYRLMASLKAAASIAQGKGTGLEESLSEARKTYDKAMSMYISAKPPEMYRASSSAMDWMTLEASDFGSKECAYALSSWAIEQMSKFDAQVAGQYIVKQSQWLKLLQLEVDRQHSITADICSQALVGFMDNRFRYAIANALHADMEAERKLPEARKKFNDAIVTLLSGEPPSFFTAANAAIQWAKWEASESGSLECAYALANWAVMRMNWYDQGVSSRWLNDLPPALKQIFANVQVPIPGPCPKDVVSFLN